MAATAYTPVEELEMFCSHCKKTMPSVLERSVAEAGRTIDENATFEYVCTKCNSTSCYQGKDLIPITPVEEGAEENEPVAAEIKEYKISESYKIGEFISHPSYEVEGLIVGKKPGKPVQLAVKFEKKIIYLVENVG